MATVTLTKDNFEQTILDNEIVLVDFWAEWCGPCRMFAPDYEDASDEHDDVVFGKVDTEAQPELAAHFNVRSIPTLMAFRDQVLLYAQPGAISGSALDELIGKVREVDMDDVRRQIEEHESRHAEESA